MTRSPTNPERENKKKKKAKERKIKKLNEDNQFKLENELMRLLSKDERKIIRKRAKIAVKQLEKMISIACGRGKMEEHTNLYLLFSIPEKSLSNIYRIMPPLIMQFLQALKTEDRENNLQNIIETLLLLKHGATSCLLLDLLSTPPPKEKELHLLDGLELCKSPVHTLNIEIGLTATLFAYMKVYSGLHGRDDTEIVESMNSFNNSHGLDANILYDVCLDIDILTSVFLVLCWYYRREWAPIYSFNTYSENLHNMEELINSEKIKEASDPNPTVRSYSELFVAAKSHLYIMQRLGALESDEEYKTIKEISLAEISPELSIQPYGRLELFSKKIGNLTREEIRFASEIVTARLVTIQTIFSSIRSKHNFVESLDMNLKRKLSNLKSPNILKLGKL